MRINEKFRGAINSLPRELKNIIKGRVMSRLAAYQIYDDANVYTETFSGVALTKAIARLCKLHNCEPAAALVLTDDGVITGVVGDEINKSSGLMESMILVDGVWRAPNSRLIKELRDTVNNAGSYELFLLEPAAERKRDRYQVRMNRNRDKYTVEDGETDWMSRAKNPNSDLRSKFRNSKLTGEVLDFDVTDLLQLRDLSNTLKTTNASQVFVNGYEVPPLQGTYKDSIDIYSSSGAFEKLFDGEEIGLGRLFVKPDGVEITRLTQADQKYFYAKMTSNGTIRVRVADR